MKSHTAGPAVPAIVLALLLLLNLAGAGAAGVEPAPPLAAQTLTIPASCDGTSGTLTGGGFPYYGAGGVIYCARTGNGVEASKDSSQRTFASFNTSAIPPSATVLSASLSLFVNPGVSNDDFTTLEVVSASQGFYLSPASWSNVGSVSFASRPLGSLQQGLMNTIALSPEGAAAVTKGGTTQYALRLGFDLYPVQAPKGINRMETVLEQGVFGMLLSVEYAAPDVSPTPTPAPSPVTGATVSYARGWNIVAGPAGATFQQASPILYTSQGGDFTILPNTQAVRPGWGYWANFAEDTTVTLTGAGGDSYSTTLSPGQFKMIGNPSGTKSATVSAEVVWTYDPAIGYARHQATAVLAPGRGAWAFSSVGGVVSIMTSAAATPTATPTP
ncbi:MAG: hypothetical protein HYX92_01250 [Chloroflexi bacterium]|nr:hypothetical protein [Chloroflexota bacterium]